MAFPGKSLSGLAFVAAIGVASATLVPVDASAQYNRRGMAPRGAPMMAPRVGGPRVAAPRGRRGGWGPGAAAAGIIGGLALGALAAGAMAPPPPAPVYGAYGPDPGCRLIRQRYWDGYSWRRRTLEVCD